MMSKLERMRSRLYKALEIYPSNSEEILRLSKLLDELICKSYRSKNGAGHNK